MWSTRKVRGFIPISVLSSTGEILLGNKPLRILVVNDNGKSIDEGDKVGVSLGDSEPTEINLSDYEILFDNDVANVKSENDSKIHGANVNEGQTEDAESNENDSDEDSDVNKKSNDENNDEDIDDRDFEGDASLEDSRECSTEDSDGPSWLYEDLVGDHNDTFEVNCEPHSNIEVESTRKTTEVPVNAKEWYSNQGDGDDFFSISILCT
ncbi:hypothetical protein U1Q18_040145 [Sarracenia purpurea var. burkii]